MITMEQHTMPDWVTTLLGGGGIAAGGLATAWAALRNGRRTDEASRRADEAKLREDLFAETRALRGEIAALRLADEQERSERETEGFRHSMQLAEAEQERRKMMLSQNSLQQTVSDSRTQISRLTSIVVAIDAAARRRDPVGWRLILIDAIGGPDLGPLLGPLIEPPGEHLP